MPPHRWLFSAAIRQASNHLTNNKMLPDFGAWQL